MEIVLIQEEYKVDVHKVHILKHILEIITEQMDMVDEHMMKPETG